MRNQELKTNTRLEKFSDHDSSGTRNEIYCGIPSRNKEHFSFRIYETKKTKNNDRAINNHYDPSSFTVKIK